MYEQPGTMIAVQGTYTVIEEHAGQDKFSIWGFDVNGRRCRMGRYSDIGRAYRALSVLCGKVTA